MGAIPDEGIQALDQQAKQVGLSREELSRRVLADYTKGCLELVVDLERNRLLAQFITKYQALIGCLEIILGEVKEYEREN